MIKLMRLAEIRQMVMNGSHLSEERNKVLPGEIDPDKNSYVNHNGGVSEQVKGMKKMYEKAQLKPTLEQTQI